MILLCMRDAIGDEHGTGCWCKVESVVNVVWTLELSIDVGKDTSTCKSVSDDEHREKREAYLKADTIGDAGGVARCCR